MVLAVEAKIRCKFGIASSDNKLRYRSNSSSGLSPNLLGFESCADTVERSGREKRGQAQTGEFVPPWVLVGWIDDPRSLGREVLRSLPSALEKYICIILR